VLAVQLTLAKSAIKLAWYLGKNHDSPPAPCAPCLTVHATTTVVLEIVVVAFGMQQFRVALRIYSYEPQKHLFGSKSMSSLVEKKQEQ
jgi:hypothetical protein